MKAALKALFRYSLISIPIVALFAVSSCAVQNLIGMRSHALTQPEEGKMLLIGSVITESLARVLTEYPDEACIMADIEEDGEIVRKLITVMCDDEGFFTLENMPQGQYAIFGIRIDGRSMYWREMYFPDERWISRSGSTLPTRLGGIFPWEPVGNIYNFGHIILVNTLGTIQYYNQHVIENENFGTPRTYSRPSVPEYFLKKYPESGWAPALREMLPDLK